MTFMESNDSKNLKRFRDALARDLIVEIFRDEANAVQSPYYALDHLLDEENNFEVTVRKVFKLAEVVAEIKEENHSGVEGIQKAFTPEGGADTDEQT